jgi:hypothetical protein
LTHAELIRPSLQTALKAGANKDLGVPSDKARDFAAPPFHEASPLIEIIRPVIGAAHVGRVLVRELPLDRVIGPKPRLVGERRE